MNKSERKQVDRALACLHSDARLAASTLATLQRSATSTKSQREITAVIEEHPGIRVLLTKLTNGCHIPRDDAARNALTLQAHKAAPRRFTGEPMTGFGNL